MKKLFAGTPHTKFIAAASVFAWLIAVATSASAAQLQEARVTQVVNDVKLLLEQGAPRPAAISDLVRHGNAVRTGTQSRSELTFADLTITRLGANTIFSFKEGTREMNLIDGAILFQVPKGSGGATIKTVGVTAAITGTTGIGEFHPATANRPQPFSKWLCLEGTFHLYLPNGQSVEVGPGKMVTTDGKSFSNVSTFDIAKLVSTSLFFTGFEQPLVSMNLIALESQNQLASIATTTTNPLDPTKIVNVTSQALVAEETQTTPSSSVSPPPPTPPPPTPPPPTPPPPTPPPPTPPPPTPPPPTPPPTTPPPPTSTPSKFGTPTVITSPVPYLITSGTVITTDPSITTNGVTDYGKIYRGPVNDGAFSLWAFGSTSAFDTALGIDNFFADPTRFPIAAFKFQSLSLTGNPTIDTSNGGVTKLALIGVGGITSGPPGGTLTFTGLDLLALGTVNGSINLTSDVSFQGLSELVMYARGAGSNLTIDSPISNVGTLELAAEGSIQLTNPGTMSVGDFHATAGDNLTLQLGGSLLLNGSVRLNTMVLPGTTLASGANLTLNVTGDYTNSSATEFSRLRVTNEGAHIGTGGNIAVSVGGNLTTNGSGGGTGDFSLVVQNTNGQIDNGGNITLATGGSISTGGEFNLLVENYNETANPAGHIGTGGNISLTTGGNFTADFASIALNNRGGGMIDSGVNLTIDIAGALTTMENGPDFLGNTASLSIAISTRYDDTAGNTTRSFIGGDATLNFHADSASIGGNLSVFLSDRGGTIDGNALLNFNVTHDVTVTGTDIPNFSDAADIELLNGSGTGVESPFGGTIHGDATLQVSATNLNVTAGSLFVAIDNENGGLIDSNATLTLNLAGNLTTQGSVEFDILNDQNQFSNGMPGGSIGLAATLDISAANISTGTDFTAQILNQRAFNAPGPGAGFIGTDATLNISASSFAVGGSLDVEIRNRDNGIGSGTGGTIGGNAAINLNVASTVSSGSSAFVQIVNESDVAGSPGGIIGGDATINVSLGDLTSGPDVNSNALVAQIDNRGGSIGGNAIINFAASGNVDAQGNAFFQILNNDGGQIGTDATVNVTAANITANSLLAQIDNSNGGMIGGAANVAINIGNNVTTPGGVTLQILNGNAGHIVTGANLLYSVGGSTSTTNLTEYIDNSNGGAIDNGGNVTLHTVGPVMLDGPLVLEIDNFNGGTITNGANVTAHFVGDVTDTVGQFHSFNFFVANGGSGFFGDLGGGTIGTGGNIDVTFDGNATTTPTATTGSFAAEIANDGGNIGTGGNISMTIGGNATAGGSGFAMDISNRGGHIGTGGNITASIAGDLTSATQAFLGVLNQGGSIGSGTNVALNVGGDLTAQAGAFFQIQNNDDGSGNGGGTIGGDAMLNLNVANISSGPNVNSTALVAQIGNTSGSIGANATINFAASGTINAQGNAFLQILNFNGNGNSGGTIGGDAMLTVSAGGDITTQGNANFNVLNHDNGFASGGGTIVGAAMVNVSATNINAGALFEQILSTGGSIGSSANVTLNLSGDLTTQGDASFIIASNNDDSGSGGGTIGTDATINLSAANITTIGGALFADIDNSNGGMIGGDATITTNAADVSLAGALTEVIFNPGGNIVGNARLTFGLTGNLNSQGDVNFQILNNNGGSIGGDAVINVNAANITANSLLAQIDNTGGSIGASTEAGAAINMNVSGTATVTNDATFQILGSDGATSAGININGGNYNVGGTFLSYIDGNGTITFNNASAHADVLKAGVFGANGALNISGGTLSADSILKLYAPGSNGQLNFMSNVTLGGNSLKILAANEVNIFNGVVVTIGGPNPADVYTNHANYTGFGGNGTRTGTFAGAGAHNPQPLSSAPPFDGTPPGYFSSTWIGTDGNWNDASKWDTDPRFPNNGQPNAGDLYDATLANGSTITLNIPITIQKLNLSAGTITGANSLTLNGLFDWTGGTLSGSGVTNANGGIHLSGSTSLERTLNNATGQIAVMGGNSELTFQGGLFNNNGTFLAQSSSGGFSGNGTFTNAGTFTRNTGAATFSITGVNFDNTGNVEAQTGTLLLDGGTSSGSFFAAAGATIALSGNYTFSNGAQLGGAGSIVLRDASETTLTGTLTNNGNILFGSLGNHTYLFLSGNVMLAGSGTVTLDNTGFDHLYAINPGDTLTIGANQTIQGGGSIGEGQTNIVNNGLLLANGSIPLQITGGSGITFTNNGTLQESGSQLQLVNNLNVVGGTLAAAGSQIHSLSSTLTNVTNSAGAGLVLSDASQTTLSGTLTNNGNILFQSLGNHTYLFLSGNVMLAGSGTVTLDNTGFDHLYAINPGDTLTIGANQTIQGSGSIGEGQTNIVNNGLLLANGSIPLQITGGSGITFTNNGTLQESGSQLQLVNNLNVVGGTLAAAGSQIHSLSSTLTNVTNSAGAGLVLSDASQTTLSGTLTNNGNILFQSLGNHTYLFLSGNVMLAGSGTVTLDNTGFDHLYAINPGDTLTIGANQTIQGSGSIGEGQTNIVNNGLLLANGSIPLQITGGSGITFTNNGTLQESGSQLQLVNNLNVVGGTLAAAGSQIHSLSSTLTNVTNSAGAGLVLSDASQTTLSGTLTNNGNILFQSLGNHTYLFLSGNVMLAGSGTVTLDNTGFDHLYAINPGDTLTIGANQTIQGSGDLGASQTTIVNNGTITADGTNTLFVTSDASTSLTNTGTIQTTNTGGIVLGNGSITSSGLIDVGNSSLTINGTSYTQTGGTLRLAGGTINSSPTLNFQGGLIDARGTIDAAMMNNATLRPALGGDLAVNGNLSLLSASQFVFQLGGTTAGQFGFVNVNGQVSLGGQLALSLVNGFNPSGSENFTLMSSSSAFVGAFTNIASGSRLETSGGEGSFLVNYSENTLTISNFVSGSGPSEFGPPQTIVKIINEGGAIGGNALINADVSGAISTQGDADFQIFNENNGSGGGSIGLDATINVSAANISTVGSLFAEIFNYGGGSIGGSAAISVNVLNDINTQSDVGFNIENAGGTIVTDATVNVSAANITANSLTAQIDNTSGSVGGNAAINMNFSGTASVTNDATVAIYGSNGASSAAINFNGGSYNVGGTFLSYTDGNGTIAFNNVNAHADVLKAGVFGANGALNISGGMLSADSTLKLYAPGSNGQLNFMSNVTLGGNSAKILAANSVTIFNNIVVTIGGPNPADVYTNHANYTGFGGNGTTTGTFAGAGANNSQPLSSAPPFGPASPVKLTIGGNIPTGTRVPPQSAPARTPAPGGNITSRTRIPPPSPSNVLTGGKIADVKRASNVINVRSSDELLSLLDDAAPGPGGKITIPPSKSTNHSKNSNRTDPAGRLNAGSRVNADRRAMDMRTASSSLMRRSPQ